MNRYRKGEDLCVAELMQNFFCTINPTTHSITHCCITMKINVFLYDFTHIKIDAFFSD